MSAHNPRIWAAMNGWKSIVILRCARNFRKTTTFPLARVNILDNRRVPGASMPAARKQLILLGLILLVSAVWLAASDNKSKAKGAEKSTQTQAAPMDDDKKIIHALNRFTFGVRPGDVERVRAIGLEKWFDEQLHPDKINDSGVESRLEPFRTLKMSTREMIENYPPGQLVRQIENGRKSMPSDPAKRAIYETRIAEYERRQENKQEKAAAGNPAGAKTNSGAD